MATYTDNKDNSSIIFNEVNQPNVLIGSKIGNNKYNIDENGNIISNSSIINAIDIDWNNAQVDGKTIKTSGDLLKYISTKSPNINSLDVNKLDWGNKTIYDQSIESTEQLLQLIEQHQGGGQDEEVFPDITNENIIGIMLSAIRALQGEVTKLRNSFTSGIISYKDEKTKMSNVIHDYIDIEPEEPLWATDESELSSIEGFNFEDPRRFSYIGENILNGADNEEYVQITGEGIWEDVQNQLKNVDDPKVYCYLTTDSLNFKVTLKTVNYNDEYKIDEENIIYKDIDFSQFGIRESINGKYNILIIIGRKQLYKKQLYYKNFIWIGIGDYLTTNMINSGYLNLNNEITSIPFYIDDRFIFNKIIFNDLTLSKLDFYSKYSDFTNEVQESNVSDDPYKYEAAHLTIRSVKKYETLKLIKDQLLDDELIYCKENGKLYIISDNTIKNISVGGGDSDNPTDNDNMTNEELIEKLEELGIIIVERSTEDNSIVSTSINNIKLNDFESIRFINSETGNKFDISVDAYGDLHSNKYEPNKSLEVNINSKSEDAINRLLKGTNRVYYTTAAGESSTNGFMDVRGFVSRYNDLCKGGSLSNITNATEHKMAGSWKLNADRIKIGSIYAPLSTDTKISCTHAFVELENTSDKDFPLDGCYLHFDRQIINENNEPEYVVSHLALKGYIPANGTFLVRGKKYRENDDANVFIKVNTFDQEWYEENGNLIDFTLLQEGEKSYSFALTYQYENLSHDDKLVISNSGTLAINGHNAVLTGLNKDDFPFLYVWNFIDAISINKQNTWLPPSSKGAVFVMKSNSIYKNMFELDPAKQAYNSLNKKDSSRSRYQNIATDCQTLELNDGYITFPKTLEYKKYVSDYTPKASFEHKNVQTDKTKLYENKPNAVTVSFGTNIFTTRCFNWVSCGLFDEYVFVKRVGESKWNVFESYKNSSKGEPYSLSSENGPQLKKFPNNVNDVVYSSLTKERLYDYFPADGTYYTSHKCIINILTQEQANELTQPEEWVYVIGKGVKNENGDIIGYDSEYHSDEMHFTMYPTTYTPKIYQTTDQQGFHWQEYQAWAAVAKKLNEVIHDECDGQPIIPILINTGDMTQSGARVSEWLDYYNAGECLFNHLEQMNIVGNNDLSPSISVNEIGTGDDADKSNAYFYNLFYCYEVNPIYLNNDTNKENPIYPIINNVYIPSLYYIDINNLRLLFLNSEITEETCQTWFKTKDSETGKICNVYTGYPTTQSQMNDTDSPYLADTLGITTIYTMIYHMTEDNSKKYIAICHEMPFTVITRDSLYYENSGKTSIESYRSISGAGALVGCHMNQISKGDFGYGIYWFSRLLEYRNIKLCLGGHKHTYCVTYPLAENYKYGDNQRSLINGPMTMEETLNNDLEKSIIWSWSGETIESEGNTIPYNSNHTKLPLTLVSNKEIEKRYGNKSDNEFIITKGSTSNSEPIFLPCHIISNNYVNEHNIHTVRYFMCQASGYKLTSNKELPSALQRFSELLPETSINNGSDKANNNQQSPMYSTISFNSDLTTYSIKLTRVRNISDDNASGAPKAWVFNQQTYSKNPIRLEYITLNNSVFDGEASEYDKYNYGIWSSTESQLFNNISL